MPQLAFFVYLLLQAFVNLVSAPSVASPTHTPHPVNIEQEIHQLKPRLPGLSEATMRLALRAYNHAVLNHLIKQPYLTVIDYSKKSTEKRLWLIDLTQHRIALNTYVAHGRNSGLLTTQHFSNDFNSKTSSLGVYLTGAPYYGHKGLSLRLRGLERGINDHAYRRAIVMHGARYVSQAFIKAHGYLGRSWGCPAVPQPLTKRLIHLIQDGSLVFAYAPNKQWLKQSHYL